MNVSASFFVCLSLVWQVLSDVVYCWYAGYFVDEAKRFFLPVWYGVRAKPGVNLWSLNGLHILRA